MNILTIEKARNELFDFLENTSSRRLKLKKISEFFRLLLDSNSTSLAESYLIELLPQYIEYLKTYSPFGVEPGFTQSIIDVNEKLAGVNGLNEFKEQLASLNDGMNEKLQSLLKILDGGDFPSTEPKVLFPVIEECEQGDNDFVLGAVDSLTIKVSKAKHGVKFIIVPSESEKDKRLEEQIKTSWHQAKEFCKKYVKKISEYHEVIISFDEHLGTYKGDSVGTALVVGFIEELLRHYNSQTILKPIVGTAFTGGVSESGEINKVSKEIVEKKVEIAFYSNCQTLVIPKDDEPFALHKLSELYQLYKPSEPYEPSKIDEPNNQHPQRNLTIVGVKDINEILLRRDLVDIKKQKLIVRTGKFMKKNWVSAVFVILLSTLLSYFLTLDLDDNPYLISAENGIINIKNKSGRILWNKKTSIDADAINDHFDLQKYFVKIIDIDEDGKNEVIITSGFSNQSLNEIKENTLTCFDHIGNKIWDYKIEDTVYSYRKGDDKILYPPYSIQIIDTVTIDHKKQLYCYGSNRNSFSSLIFRIDLKSGKRIPGALWSSGHTLGAFIIDINNDGVKDIVAKGADNGYNQIVLFGKSIENLMGFRKTISEYSFRYLAEAELLFYIRIPKTDLDELEIGERFASKDMGRFWYDQTKQKIVYRSSFSMSTPKLTSTAIEYQINNNLKDIDLIIFDEFRTVRDTLVKQCKLNLPYTDTPEYKNIIKSKILFYKDGNWVKRKELE